MIGVFRPFRILNTTLPNNLLQLAGLRGCLSSLELHKGILDLPYLLILLINTIHKTKRKNLRLTPRPHFISLELQVFSNSTPITQGSINVPIQHKSTTIDLTIYKYCTRTKLRHFNRGRSKGKLSNPWGNKRKSWTHLSSSFH